MRPTLRPFVPLLSAAVLGLPLACGSTGDDLFGGSGTAAGGATTSHTGSGNAAAEGGTGATGASTTTSGTGAQGAGGGPVGSEDCLNGSDDDANGLADCDDPTCSTAGYWCAQAAPGAQAFLAVGGQACSAPAVSASLLTCEGCSCEPEQGSCRVSLQAFVQPGCQQLYAQPQGPGCFDAQPNGQRWFRQGTTESYGDEQCWPVEGYVEPATHAACRLDTGGHCGGGGACLPPSFQGLRNCVLVPAASPCPTAYPARIEAYSSGELCGCDCEVGGVTCGQPVVQVDGSSDWCQNDTGEIVIGQDCTAVGYAGSIRVPDVPSQPTCELRTQLDDQDPVHAVCCPP